MYLTINTNKVSHGNEIPYVSKPTSLNLKCTKEPMDLYNDTYTILVSSPALSLFLDYKRPSLDCSKAL